MFVITRDSLYFTQKPYKDVLRGYWGSDIDEATQFSDIESAQTTIDSLVFFRDSKILELSSEDT